MRSTRRNMTEHKKRLANRILAARKELRTDAGGPLAEEDVEEERRRKVVAELEDEAYRIGMDSEMTLYCLAVWKNGPTIKIEPWPSASPVMATFYLRPEGKGFQLFQADPARNGENLIGSVPRGEAQPMLANRVLVAIGDALEGLQA
jgi:hypothetical protein